jgi:ubiquinone/menaquinone biosynthesis C-methylase UbiE
LRLSESYVIDTSVVVAYIIEDEPSRDKVVELFVQSKKKDRHISPFLFSLTFPVRRLFENQEEVLKYVKEGMTVLDHGCGPGYYTIPIARRVKEKGLVYAIDSDRRQIEVLNRKLQKLKINNVITYVSRYLSPIPSNSVDFVLSKDVLCCTVLHRELAEDIVRVLKPEGMAYVSVRKGFSSDPRSISAKELFSLFPTYIARKNGLLSAWVLFIKKNS